MTLFMPASGCVCTDRHMCWIVCHANPLPSYLKPAPCLAGTEPPHGVPHLVAHNEPVTSLAKRVRKRAAGQPALGDGLDLPYENI